MGIGNTFLWHSGHCDSSSVVLTPQWLQLCESEVPAVNATLRHAMKHRENLIIIGRNCQPTVAALQGMADFADNSDVDPMIMFAAPRDDSGPVTGLPLPRPSSAIDDSLRRLTRLLPRHTYVPRLFPSCVLIKPAFLKEIGLLDEVYGTWSTAMDDLSLRANAFGFRAIMLNHIYIHSESTDTVAADENLLMERYPEAESTLQQYLASARRTAETLVCRLVSPERRIIAFDFSYFSTGHDGTNEAGIKLLRAAASVWIDYDIAVIASPDVWKAHKLEDIPNLSRLEPGDTSAQAFAIIRMGQPWRGEELPPIFRCAPVVTFFMLDTIGYDCLYNAAQVPGLDDVWSFVASFADGVFTQSHFTLKRLEERLHFDGRCRRVVTHHSLDVDDYGHPSPEEGTYILVIGNHFKHKFVTPTVNKLADLFPDRSFVAVGYAAECSRPNVICVTSGQMDDATFFALYDKALCVVFPSTYEGFGFPILHALARGKVVYARCSALYDELKQSVRYGENLRQFTDSDDLVRQMARHDAYNFVYNNIYSCIDIDGWKRSAIDIISTIKYCAHNIEYEKIVERLRWCALFTNNIA